MGRPRKPKGPTARELQRSKPDYGIQERVNGTFQVSFHWKCKRVHGGTYKTKEEARAARDWQIQELKAGRTISPKKPPPKEGVLAAERVKTLQKYVDEGLSGRQIADRMSIAEATARKYAQLYKEELDRTDVDIEKLMRYLLHNSWTPELNVCELMGVEDGR